jgi:hypothetical protein
MIIIKVSWCRNLYQLVSVHCRKGSHEIAQYFIGYIYLRMNFVWNIYFFSIHEVSFYIYPNWPTTTNILYICSLTSILQIRVFSSRPQFITEAYYSSVLIISVTKRFISEINVNQSQRHSNSNKRNLENMSTIRGLLYSFTMIVCLSENREVKNIF